MKRICLILIVLIGTMMFCACNYSAGCGNLSFEKIHIDTHHFSGCYTVEKWYSSENGLEVKTKELGAIFVSEGTYILVEDKCPI